MRLYNKVVSMSLNLQVIQIEMLLVLSKNLIFLNRYNNIEVLVELKLWERRNHFDLHRRSKKEQSLQYSDSELTLTNEKKMTVASGHYD